MTKPTDEQIEDGNKLVLALALEDAWRKYTEFFGVPPHGTLKQIRAMLELIGDKSIFASPAALRSTTRGRV